MGVRSQRAVEVGLAVGRELVDVYVSLGTAWSLSVTYPVLALFLGVCRLLSGIHDIYNFRPQMYGPRGAAISSLCILRPDQISHLLRHSQSRRRSVASGDSVQRYRAGQHQQPWSIPCKGCTHVGNTLASTTLNPRTP